MTFQFKIQIKGISKPPVWRRVRVNSEVSFRDMHNLIQLAFGWDFSHLYSFSEKAFSNRFSIEDPEFMDDMFDSDTADSSKVKLKDIFKKEKQQYTYVYDFGDSWEHKITLEKIIKDELLMFPVCMDGKGQCPPEDCGGVGGYEYMKEVLSNPADPEYENMLEWLFIDEGESWDPHEFDIEEVNEVLREEWSLGESFLF